MAVISLTYPELLNCSQSSQITTLGARVFLCQSVRSDTEDRIEVTHSLQSHSVFVYKNTEEILCPRYAGKKGTKPLETDFIITSSAYRFTIHSRAMENSGRV